MLAPMMGKWAFTERAKHLNSIHVATLKPEEEESVFACVPFATSEPCGHCLHDEELRVPADRPPGAGGVPAVGAESPRKEGAAAAEEVGGVPGEEPVLLRWTDHPSPTERCPSTDTWPYRCHLWPFLCFWLPFPGGACDRLHTCDRWGAFCVCGHILAEDQLYRPRHFTQGHPRRSCRHRETDRYLRILYVSPPSANQGDPHQPAGGEAQILLHL